MSRRELKSDDTLRSMAEAEGIRLGAHIAEQIYTVPQADLDLAVNGLARREPVHSAKHRLWGWQKWGICIFSVVIGVVALVAPVWVAAILLAVLAIPFLSIAALRILAFRHLALKSGSKLEPANLSGTVLPRYAILVPLFQEAEVVACLLEALRALDYPVDRLEISLIVEEDDDATRRAVSALHLPQHVRVVVVPVGAPRTKPRALNYALQTARGDFVVVYDAEDVPEPDQLRRALGVLLSNEGRRFGCVQARLNVYNRQANWLSRQFAIEYTALFDAILPTLQALDFPVPLGGTSNHFPRHVLESTGGWDPYNVTEDADLGIRLARKGWRVGVLSSTTWEEAPESFGVWFRQRTRWLKGWIQTYLVHMREPGRILHELGAVRFAGLQLLMVGMIVSALVHPWFYVVLAVDASDGRLLEAPPTIFGWWFYYLSLLNLLAGYLSAILLGVLAVIGRRWYGLVGHVAIMPVYWLAISFAAYRALFQLVTAPHLWEKTTHTPRPMAASLDLRDGLPQSNIRTR